MTPQEQLNADADAYRDKCFGMSHHYSMWSKADFSAGALSPTAANGCNKHVEIAKIEFAIEKVTEFRNCTFGKGKDVLKELNQQLEALKQTTE